jgi:hypothetical protein
MTDFLISNRYAQTTRTKPKEFRGVRAYKQSPFNVNLQIFTGSDKQTLIASCSLDVNQCRALATELTIIADTLRQFEIDQETD